LAGTAALLNKVRYPAQFEFGGNLAASNCSFLACLVAGLSVVQRSEMFS
jgi:hypothetical protein